MGRSESEFAASLYFNPRPKTIQPGSLLFLTLLPFALRGQDV